MPQDKHADAAGGYQIRSLYFDDLHNTCYYENESGVDERSKFRIRYYNDDLTYISLEKILVILLVKLFEIHGRLPIALFFTLVFYKGSLELMSRAEGIALINHHGLGSIHVPDFEEFVQALLQSVIDTLYYYVGSISKMSLYGAVSLRLPLLLLRDQ